MPTLNPGGTLLELHMCIINDEPVLEPGEGGTDILCLGLEG